MSHPEGGSLRRFLVCNFAEGPERGQCGIIFAKHLLQWYQFPAESEAWLGMERRKGWSGFRVGSRITFVLFLPCFCRVSPITTLLSLNWCLMPVHSGHAWSWLCLWILYLACWSTQLLYLCCVKAVRCRHKRSTFLHSSHQYLWDSGWHHFSLQSWVLPALDACHHSFSVRGILGSQIPTTSGRFCPA